MELDEKKSFNFKNQNIAYAFDFEHGSIKITAEDEVNSCVYQGIYSNDSLPQIFIHFFENVKDLFMSLQTTEHQCFSIYQSSLTLDVMFMNKKKRLTLPLQKNEEPIQKKQKKQIKKLEEKVKILESQIATKDLIILEQASQLQNLRFIVQNFEQQFQKKNIKKQEPKIKKEDLKKQQVKCLIQKFVLDKSCKFNQNYKLNQKKITKTLNQGAYYQLWGEKLDKNKTYCLEVKVNKLNSSSFGIGIQTNKTLENRWIDMQTEVIQYYGYDHHINYLGKSSKISNPKEKIKAGTTLKIVVENKKNIEFYINGAIIYQNIIQKNIAESDLFPFIQLMGIGDEIQII